MPYIIKGDAVYKRDTGKLVGHSKNPKKYLKALLMAEHNPEAMRGYKSKKARGLP
jgi:hypothetical protein